MRSGGTASVTVSPRRARRRALGASWAFAILGLILAPAARATDTICDGTAKDGGGYVCRTYTGDRAPDISSDGSAITTWSPPPCEGDDCYRLVNLPDGADFAWYGTTYTSVYVGSNGYVTFGAGATDEVSSLSIPTADVPNNAIYAYGHDLVPNTSTDLVYHKATPCAYDGDSDGTNDDCLVVQWHNVPLYQVAGSSVRVQLALDLDTDEALIEIEAETDESGAAPRLLGVENPAGAAGLWFKGSGDPDSRSAAAGARRIFSRDLTAPLVVSAVPADDATNVLLIQPIQVTFDRAMNTASVALAVFFGANPGGWNANWTPDSKTVTYTHDAFDEASTVVLRITGQAAGGSTLGNTQNGNLDCTSGYCWNFATTDSTPIQVTALTSASGSGQATLEFEQSVAPDLAGDLVLRKAGSAMTAAPTDGVTYTAGETIGDATVVADITGGPPWTDAAVANGTIYYYRVFAYDDGSPKYSLPAEITGRPQVASECKWTFSATAPTLSPVGIAGDEATTSQLIATGNDRLLQRMAAADGARGAWTPPLLGGASQHRPVVGDPLTDGAAQGMKAFVATQVGRLLRYNLVDAGEEGNVDVLEDAGCAVGWLQAAPVVVVDAYDANANNDDDAVIQATRCSASNNKIMLYDHSLALADSYAGGGLGVSNGAPMILYRNDANNLVYVPVRQGAGGETLVALEVGSDGGGGPLFVVPPFAVVRAGVGSDAAPVVFRKTEGAYLVMGDLAGALFLYRADAHVDADGTGAGTEMTLPLREFFMGSVGHGPVKGLSASTPIPAGGGGEEVWVAWSTDTEVHAIKVDSAGLFDETTYRLRTISGVSAPLVLRNVRTGVGPYIYVGADDGNGYELDVNSPSLAITRTFTVESGKTVGEATFDYHDGLQQGIVFGATNGAIRWFKLQ